MRKFTVIAGLLAALVFQAGCCHVQLTPPSSKFYCGKAAVLRGTPPSVPTVGSILVVYARPELAPTHKTSWTIDEKWRAVGSRSVLVKPGLYRMQFWAKKGGHLPPSYLDLKVKAGETKVVLVSYEACVPPKLAAGKPSRVGMRAMGGGVHTMDTGSVVVLAPVAGGAPSGYGKLRVIYKAPDTYTTNPTKWNIDGGSWRLAGSAAVTVYAGQHVVQFMAVKGGDRPPANQVPNVPSTKLVQLRISYAP